MNLILERRVINYDQYLTYEALLEHANGFLRYQNFSDLVLQGPQAVQAFIDRSNLLFFRNLDYYYPGTSDQVEPLELSYLSVFFRYASESKSEALPMTDFLKFRFKDHGVEKNGFGVFFSFFGRELDRAKLESGRRTLNISTSMLVYQLMFKKLFPEVGVLEEYPIMTMRQARKDNANDLVHQYYTQLGTRLQSIQPLQCPGILRCYHHGNWESIDPKVRIAAISLGQAMQECVRVEEYRWSGDPETRDLPVFDRTYHGQVKDEQALLARKWFAEHRKGILKLVESHQIRRQMAVRSGA